MFFCWGILFSGDNWPRVWSCRLLILEAVEAGLRRQASDLFNIQSTPAHSTNDSLSSTPRHDPSGNLRQPCVKKRRRKKSPSNFSGAITSSFGAIFFPPKATFPSDEECRAAVLVTLSLSKTFNWGEGSLSNSENGSLFREGWNSMRRPHERVV